MHHTHHKERGQNISEYLLLAFFTLAVGIGFVYIFQYYHSLPSKAQDYTIAFKIKLQGETHPLEIVKANVTLYKSLGKVKEFKEVIFVSQLDKTFEGMITLDSEFDYKAFYAVYIKPQKYFGKLFCNTNSDGKNCTSPQFIFLKRGQIIDLSSLFFSGGDVDPANGRVDSYDISKIMANLGKSSDITTDINNDGMTSTFDYLLALYSLDKNVTDDVFSLIVPWAPSPTITPPIATPTFPFPKNSPIPTFYPTSTKTPIPIATIMPTPLSKGVCQLIPSTYAKNTCGIKKFEFSASARFSKCENISAFHPNCRTYSLSRKCSCPDGKICICKLKDIVNQTIECTQEGALRIVTCN